MKAFTRLLCLCGVLALLSVYVFGQRETGTITGTVTDPSGAVVAGANVTVKSAATGATRTTTTTNAGLFTITNLMPGQYNVTVESPNFAKYTELVTVTIGSLSEMSPKLKVAAAGTSVEVSAAAEAVQPNTVNQELSETITSRQVSELPTLTRNPYDLAATAGNVSNSGEAVTRGVGVSINGQRSASTDILLDGAENVDLFTASVGQNVPLDSVQEFSLLTSSFTAEYGRAGGGVVNVATKSGTNAFHGTAYEFNRISALAANTYDNTSARSFAQNTGACDPTLPATDPASCASIGKKGVFTRNQFGYSIGGPVIKDKLFFFQSTEWTRIRSNATISRFVPTPEFIAASDPATQAFFAGVPSAVRSGAQVTNVLTAAQVQNDISANGAFANLATAQPNLPVLQQEQFAVPTDSGGGEPSNRYSLVGRGDWIISDKTTLYGRYALENQQWFPGTIAFSSYAGYDTGQDVRNQNMLLSLNHVFTPTLVSTTKATYNRLNLFQPLGTNAVGPSAYFKANTSSSVAGTLVDLPGYLPESPGNAIPFGGPQNVYQFTQDVSWTHGTHQFRFGGMFLHTRDNRVFGAYEEAVEDFGAKLGPGFDGFVAGRLFDFQAAVNPQGKFPCPRSLVDGSLQVTPACTIQLPVGPPKFSRNNRYNDFAFYGQDTWKIFPRLSLNLGLRWEYYGVQHNQDPNLDSNFYFGSGSTIFDRIRSGSVQIADKSPIGGLWAQDKNNFAPRIGFAWDIFGDGKTSLRGGYGMAYERNFGNVTFNVIQNPPNYAVLGITQSDLPTGQILAPTPNNAGPLAGTGQKPLPPVTLRAVDPNIATAYSEFYNLSLEREVTHDTLLSFDYTGSHGVKLYDISNINKPFYGSLLLGDARAANRLDPQFGNINFRGGNGFSYYNALNVGLRSVNLWHSGVQFKVNYTYSHAIDNLSTTFSETSNAFNLGYTDAFNPRFDKGDADFDVRHRFVISGIWDVPWYKNASNGIVRHVLGGWEFAPIFQVRTGTPYTIYDCDLGNQTCPRWLPNSPVSRTGNPVQDMTTNNSFKMIDMASAGSATLDSGIPYLDTANCTGLRFTGVCTYPPGFQRNHFLGPNNWTADLGIYKNFKVTERVSLQFRGEMYNLFNHHNMYIVTDATDFASANFITAKKGGPFPGNNTQPTATGSDERRNVQFGLKVIF